MFILDSSVLISFYREMGVPEILDLFIQNGHSIVVPSRVYGEIKGASFVQLTKAIESRAILLCSKINPQECDKFKFKHPALSNGEIEVILLGLYLKSKGKEYWCVLDDKTARNTAKRLGLNVIGTIGLVGYMEKERYISLDQKNNLLKILESSTFRV